MKPSVLPARAPLPLLVSYTMPANARHSRAQLLILLVIGLMALGPPASAQPGTGAISGIVTYRDGLAFEKVGVQASNNETGVTARAQTDKAGEYELSGLPPGTYTVSFTPDCCSFLPYSDGSVRVAAGSRESLDVAIEETLIALGDDPGIIASEIRARQVIPDDPVPRTAGGVPDLSGVWLMGADRFPRPANALPWAQEVAQARIANDIRDHPHTRCLPSSLPVGGSATPFIAKFVQTPELLLILTEDVPGYRQIFLDGRAHPEYLSPTWMGHSIGHWEDDTLIVDTIGFNDRGWTGTYPRTEMLRVEERYTRSEYGHMEVEVAFRDPGVFVEPWVENLPFDLAPQEELLEYVCENNKWARDATN